MEAALPTTFSVACATESSSDPRAAAYQMTPFTSENFALPPDSHGRRSGLFAGDCRRGGVSQKHIRYNVKFFDILDLHFSIYIDIFQSDGYNNLIQMR